MKVLSVEKCGVADVYNMATGTHNFAINGGFIVHNCDALRYFCAARNMKAEKPAAQRDDDDGDTLESYDDAMTGGEPTQSYLMYG